MFNGFSFEELDYDGEAEQLLSGFIASIGIVGRRFFKQDIATINFGQDSSSIKITVINRDMIQDDKTINFVYFYKGEEKINRFGEITTTIFMELKNRFKLQSPDVSLIKSQIDGILEKKYSKILEVEHY